jgi:hypothetical protein
MDVHQIARNKSYQLLKTMLAYQHKNEGKQGHVPHQLQYPIFYSCPRSPQGHLRQSTKTICYQNLLLFVTGLLDASSNTQLLNSGANQFRCKVRAWQNHFAMK